MDTIWRTSLWQQFGAAIDMLENALRACPDELWRDRSGRPEFWYVAFHTLFWLDLYLCDAGEGFAPPAPFTLSELDPAGVLPERPYTKKELHNYLEHGRRKCRTRIETLTGDEVERRFVFGRVDLCVAELLLYNLRHVQHHAAQLNLLLRQTIDTASPWVFRAESDTLGE